MPARRTFGQQSESKRVLKGFETTEFGVRSFINFRSVEHIQRNSVVKPIKGLISQNRKGRCWVYFYGTPLSPPVGVFSQYFYEGKCCCKGPDVCEFIDFRRRQQIVEGKKDPISRFGLGIGPERARQAHEASKNLSHRPQGFCPRRNSAGMRRFQCLSF